MFKSSFCAPLTNIFFWVFSTNFLCVDTGHASLNVTQSADNLCGACHTKHNSRKLTIQNSRTLSSQSQSFEVKFKFGKSRFRLTIGAYIFYYEHDLIGKKRRGLSLNFQHNCNNFQPVQHILKVSASHFNSLKVAYLH